MELIKITDTNDPDPNKDYYLSLKYIRAEIAKFTNIPFGASLKDKLTLVSKPFNKSFLSLSSGVRDFLNRLTYLVLTNYINSRTLYFNIMGKIILFSQLIIRIKLSKPLTSEISAKRSPTHEI